MKKVFVSGCYDLLHSGHVEFFRQAAQYGDLYVGIGSDETILHYKGHRTLYDENERLFMVKAIRYVKDAFINKGSGIMDFIPTVDMLKPDILVVNEDGDKEEKRRFCKERGIEYVVLERTPHVGPHAAPHSALDAAQSLIPASEPESQKIAGQARNEGGQARNEGGQARNEGVQARNEGVQARNEGLKSTLKRLWKNKVYREGVIAQVFYVAAQIMVWTFIIQYADNLGINKATAQNYNIIAMCLFLVGRFLSTWLMKYTDGRKLLTIFGVCAAICSLGAIVIVGKAGLWCLVGISLFMSLMFPTIYGTALGALIETPHSALDAAQSLIAGQACNEGGQACNEGGQACNEGGQARNEGFADASLGAAFLVMAIVGGALMPPLQGMIIDCGTVFGHPAVNVSYVLPLICFVVVAIYGARSRK